MKIEHTLATQLIEPNYGPCDLSGQLLHELLYHQGNLTRLEIIGADWPVEELRVEEEFRDVGASEMEGDVQKLFTLRLDERVPGQHPLLDFRRFLVGHARRVWPVLVVAVLATTAKDEHNISEIDLGHSIVPDGSDGLFPVLRDFIETLLGWIDVEGAVHCHFVDGDERRKGHKDWDTPVVALVLGLDERNC